MNNNYDSSWNAHKNEQEPIDEQLRVWEKRCWASWFQENLTFPFMVTIIEDDYGHFSDIDEELKVIGVGFDDDLYGIQVKIRDGRRIKQFPLCDVALVQKDHPNQLIIDEYFQWFVASH